MNGLTRLRLRFIQWRAKRTLVVLDRLEKRAQHDDGRTDG